MKKNTSAAYEDDWPSLKYQRENPGEMFAFLEGYMGMEVSNGKNYRGIHDMRLWNFIWNDVHTAGVLVRKAEKMQELLLKHTGED